MSILIDIKPKNYNLKRNSNSFTLQFGVFFLISSLILTPLVGLFFNPSSNIAKAEEFALNWAINIGGSGYDISIYDIDSDSNEDVFVLGSFSGTVDFDPGAATSNLTSAGSDDGFVAKFESDGSFIWVKSVGGAGADFPYNIALDSSDNIYMTGYFSGTADFDPGVGVTNIASAGNTDGFTLKLDSSGNFVWAKSVGSTTVDRSLSVGVDSSNNVYTTGYFSGTVDFDPGVGTSNLVSVGSDDIFISKLDSSGNFVWAKSVGGTSNDGGYNLGLDSSGNVYVAGNFKLTVDFDPGLGTSNLVSAGNGDIFDLKLDSSGNFVWAKSFGNAAFDTLSFMTTDSSGNSYLTGYYANTVDFDPGAGTSNLTSNGSNDTYVLKLDSSGNYSWAKSIGGTNGEYGYALSVDPSGNVYISGESYSTTMDFDPGAGTYNLTLDASGDIFLLSLDQNGSFVWGKVVGGTGDDYSWTMHNDSDSNLYTGGWFEGTADFDPGAGTNNLISAGNYDTFILKLSPLAAPTVQTPTESLVSATSATLNSNITATGGEDATSRGFEYGLDTGYGTSVGDTGTFSTGAFNEQITGLTCGTTYYYRAFATNSVDTTNSTGSSFTTSSCSTSGSSSSSSGGPLSENPTAFTSETCIGSSTTDSCVTQTEINGGAVLSPPNGNSTNIATTESGSTVQTFLRNLGFGNVGEDVKRLQQFLNQNNFILATSSYGSPGHETTYYGPRTTRAITRFQEYYKDQILTPLDLSKGTGYFGEKTRGFVNSILD